jgi:hypothetical protein
VRADAAEAGFKTVMNRARLLVRISSIIQYDNLRRAPDRAVFQPNFPPSTAGNAHQNRQSPADRPRVCKPGKHSKAPATAYPLFPPAAAGAAAWTRRYGVA